VVLALTGPSRPPTPPGRWSLRRVAEVRLQGRDIGTGGTQLGRALLDPVGRRGNDEAVSVLCEEFCCGKADAVFAADARDHRDRQRAAHRDTIAHR
jgi:hypothetical protein